MATIIRTADVADAAAIAEIHVASWRAAYRGIVPDAHLAALDVRERAVSWRDRLAADDRRTRTLLAEEDGRVVGFLTAGPTRDDDLAATTGEVYALYVAPDRWSRGVGRGLLAAGLDTLSSGHDRVTLWVLGDNRPARGFYEAMGFMADGSAKTDVIGGAALTEVRYARVIPPRPVGPAGS